MLTTRNNGDNNALSKLQPAQVRELREGFQTLDRDSDGQVGREDVADMLTQLGESSHHLRPRPSHCPLTSIPSQAS
jgi:Ca2+-binding EF-hand superfamily protein